MPILEEMKKRKAIVHPPVSPHPHHGRSLGAKHPQVRPPPSPWLAGLLVQNTFKYLVQLALGRPIPTAGWFTVAVKCGMVFKCGIATLSFFFFILSLLGSEFIQTLLFIYNHLAKIGVCKG
jgi:hypothetical protein